MRGVPLYGKSSKDLKDLKIACPCISYPCAIPISQLVPTQLLITKFIKEDLPFCLTRARPAAAMVLWCFALNTHRRPRYLTLLWCDKGKLRIQSPSCSNPEAGPSVAPVLRPRCSPCLSPLLIQETGYLA